ncbi:hypothetical protein PTKIN_Ptkin07bG0087100 [Pterospermum kingtungense]
MSESKPLVGLQSLLLTSDSDMTVAAQQLLQLSDIEDNNSSSSNSYVKNNERKKIKQSQDGINTAMIEEIFGKEEILRPIKKAEVSVP